MHASLEAQISTLDTCFYAWQFLPSPSLSTGSLSKIKDIHHDVDDDETTTSCSNWLVVIFNADDWIVLRRIKLK